MSKLLVEEKENMNMNTLGNEKNNNNIRKEYEHIKKKNLGRILMSG